MSMYALTHAGVAAALLAAKKKSTSIDVAIIVDHTMMHCSGSKLKDLLAGDVTDFVGLLPRFMQHHKYVLLDDRIVVHGSVSLTQHAGELLKTKLCRHCTDHEKRTGQAAWVE
ncbi:hypothetical protein Gpo141_00007203 [Globisporangium polare]